MFRRKPNEVVVALDDETLAKMNSLTSDANTIVELLSEFCTRLTELRETIERNVQESVGDLPEEEPEPLDDVIGVHVLSDEIEEPLPMPKDKMVDSHPWQHEGAGMTGESTVLDEDRIRNSPFARVPRTNQVAWLVRFMSDGNWYASMTIARLLGDESRQIRYISHGIQGRFREMHQDGELERRPSEVRGSMFEYRLKKT